MKVKLLDPNKYWWEYFESTLETYARYHLKKAGSSANFARIIDKKDHVVCWVNIADRQQFNSLKDAQTWAETKVALNA